MHPFIPADQKIDNLHHRPLLSIVTPAFNEAENVARLYERLSQVLSCVDVNWNGLWWMIIQRMKHLWFWRI